MEKVAIGIPCYGPQSRDWWLPLMYELLEAQKLGIEIVDIYAQSTMATDYNRNSIARTFQDGEAEWLWWIDADNKNLLGTLRTLLDHQKTLVEGLYFRRSEEKPLPIAYWRVASGLYEPISGWRRGEILPVDAGGMNTLLSHRSVYEDLEANYIPLLRPNGSLMAVHQDDIVGDVWDDTEGEFDNKIVDGVYHMRMRQPGPEDEFRVPLFALEYGRTEDMMFYENAKRVGHQLWVDTSLECEHLHEIGIKGKHYRLFIQKGKEYGPAA